MIMTTNTIKVVKGHADEVIERFRVSKGIHKFPGFVRMQVLKTMDVKEYDEIRVCTTWESMENFHNWVNSDSFRGAHAKRTEQQASKENSIMLGSQLTCYEIQVEHLPEEYN
ncbi:antibiotic biosynthesis monooxygenase [Gottfriedia sp. NPDC056225]|uniref:antibiotic biosynthesis monooxygenase n=1 Tax=Gottfriedia sp. NPDC056225 TaxID=3345751 RepID=UPI00155981EC|nr:antibiotic biosynthesis monooxygenase [Arthrobacter citreus]